MEVGCAEGGVLLPFLQKGCSCVGVDLAEARVEQAKEFLKEYVQQGKATLVAQNIYDEDFVEKYQGSFDIIILKDLIHVPEQREILSRTEHVFCAQADRYFLVSPLACPLVVINKFAKASWRSNLPYYHILPRGLYTAPLKTLGESEGNIIALQEI